MSGKHSASHGIASTAPSAIVLALALVGILGLLFLLPGCNAARARSGGTGASNASSSYRDAIATPAEVRSLLDGFRFPNTPTPEERILLGPQGNDYSTWYRAQLLGRTDLVDFVNDIAAQWADKYPRAGEATAAFEQMVRSRGASEALYQLQASEFADITVQRNRDLYWLSTAAQVFGVFGAKGRLVGVQEDDWAPDVLRLKNVSVDGDIATLMYARRSGPRAKVVMRLRRAADGSLRVVQWVNCRETLGEIDAETLKQLGMPGL